MELNSFKTREDMEEAVIRVMNKIKRKKRLTQGLQKKKKAKKKIQRA